MDKVKAINIAEDYILNKFGDEIGIDLASVIEEKDFFHFTFNSKKYLKTGDFVDAVVGQGSHFIDKKDARIFSFGSDLGYEESLKSLREKLQVEGKITKYYTNYSIQKKFYLIILNITKKQRLIDVLMKYRLHFVVPELVAGDVYRVPETHTKKTINKALNHLPVTLHGISQSDFGFIIIELLAIDCGHFEIQDTSLLPKIPRKLKSMESKW